MPKIAPTAAPRPPIVAVVGHIDHGKSTLLDYIRKTNVAEGEAGGITQHLSAYEAVHTPPTGGPQRRITFLDTPGHEAFRGMRVRGLEAADVAILVVSSEDGVKPQTLEAYKLITAAGLPCIVALSKIDKPGSNIEKAKLSLLEHQIFLEGLGGDVPWVGISSKSGEGIPELLDLIVLAAELRGLSSNPQKPGEGLVLEAHVDPKRGNTATLIVRDGHIASGQYVVAGAALAPVRIMENFIGKTIQEGNAGSPVRIVGFSKLPAAGTKFITVATKKEAEAIAGQSRTTRSEGKTRPSGPERPSGSGAATPTDAAETQEQVLVLPLVIKTDVAGVGEAVTHELAKLPQDPRLELRVVARGVGTISEGDVKLVGRPSASAGQGGIIIGFNVKVEPQARDLAERQGVHIATFDVIYKLAEWLQAEVAKRRPKTATEVSVGKAKVLKFFSNAKGRVVVGGRVEQGALKQNQEVRIMRRDVVLGVATIVGLQSNKKEVREVAEGEFGVMLKTQVEPAPGDTLEAFVLEYT